MRGANREQRGNAFVTDKSPKMIYSVGDSERGVAHTLFGAGMSRLTITLSDQERHALQTLADRELRDPRDQVVLILREGLQRRGLIPVRAEAALNGSNCIRQDRSNERSMNTKKGAAKRRTGRRN